MKPLQKLGIKVMSIVTKFHCCTTPIVKNMAKIQFWCVKKMHYSSLVVKAFTGIIMPLLFAPTFPGNNFEEHKRSSSNI